MWLRVSCYLEFELVFPTPFILMLRPRSGAQQWVEREEYIIVPRVEVIEYSDLYGNLSQRLIAPVGKFSIRTSADVKIQPFVDTCPGAPFVEVQYLPDHIINYLLPSRYCESDRFNEMAQEITANQLPGYDQVNAIEKWLRENIHYTPGLSEYPISAIEVNQKKSGVCRDLAHVGIALCRSLSIPARMVVGYLHQLHPMDMHAWFEAYVGGRWYTFDATQSGRKGGYVAVGYGHDASDVAVFNQFGFAAYPLQQVVNVAEINNEL
jgi:transglutaminase-like putative cysteine protease